MKKIKVVLADDHEFLREGISAVLEAEGNYDIVGATGDGLLVESLVLSLAPDLLVLDLTMPGLHGLEVLRRVHRRAPQVTVVIFTMHHDPQMITEAFRLGTMGYVVKTAEPELLLQVLGKALCGERFLAYPGMLVPIPENQPMPFTLDASSDVYETLSDREREVLKLTTEGLTLRQMSERLFISPRTIEKHRRSLMSKLDIDTLAGLMWFATTRGVAGPFPPPVGGHEASGFSPQHVSSVVDSPSE